jgi:hypothetical protein
MPNEFKVKNGLFVDQGGATITGSVIATGGFTGSLQGTSSWATNALTASFISTASTNAFVQGGNSFGATALLGTNDNQSLAFETSGSVRVFVSSSGNVGIGTSTPAQKLTVSGAIYSNDAFVSTAVFPQLIGFATLGAASSGVGFYTNTWRGTYSGNPFSYVANSYTSSVINYGLVLTRPSNAGFGQFQLYVKTDNTSVIDLGGGGPILDIANNGTVYSRFDGTNFSIGASSALARLYARGTGTTSATTAFRVDNSNASASLVVLDNGNVGVGTTTPSQTLTVNGNISASGNLFINTGSNQIRIGDNLNDNVSTDTFKLYNVGINGFLGTYFYNSSLELKAGASGSSFVSNWSKIEIKDNFSSPGYIRFFTSGSERAQITNAGNFGIGTTSPSSTLDVSGSARITNNLTVTGSLIVRSGSSELINTRTYLIRDQNATESISWGNNNRFLYDNSGMSSVQWGDRFLVNNNGSSYTVNWQSLHLNDNSYILSADWGNRVLYDTTGNSSVDWENRILYEPSNTFTALDYSNDGYLNSQLYYRNIIPGQVQRKLAETPASYYGGQVIQATVDVGVTDFQLVFLDTDGTWKATKATVANGAAKMLGICVDQAGGYVLIEGDVGVSDDNSQGAYVIGADHGLPAYVSTTTGVMTTTTPSGTGELVRIVGHIYYQSTTDTNWWTMKFRPSNDWYVI